MRKHPGDALALRYQRGGEPREARFEVTSRAALDEFGKVRDMGWVGLGHRRLAAMVGVPNAEGPAHRAGLRSGDVIVSLGGKPVEDWSAPGRGLRGGRGPACAPEIDRGPEAARARSCSSSRRWEIWPRSASSPPTCWSRPSSRTRRRRARASRAAT